MALGLLCLSIARVNRKESDDLYAQVNSIHYSETGVFLLLRIVCMLTNLQVAHGTLQPQLITDNTLYWSTVSSSKQFSF